MTTPHTRRQFLATLAGLAVAPLALTRALAAPKAEPAFPLDLVFDTKEADRIKDLLNQPLLSQEANRAFIVEAAVKVRTYERIDVEYDCAYFRQTFTCYQRTSSWPDVFIIYPNTGGNAYSYRGQMCRNQGSMPLWPVNGFEVDMDRLRVTWRELT